MKDGIEMKGKIRFVGKHSDGSVFCDKEIENTVEADGKTVVATLMYGTGTAFTAIAIGTGTGGTTTLGTEIPNNTYGGGRRSGGNVTESNPSGAIAQWVTTFTFTGSYAVTEEGIFNSGTISAGTMLAYQSFSAINVVSGDTISITHQITLS